MYAHTHTNNNNNNKKKRMRVSLYHVTEQPEVNRHEWITYDNEPALCLADILAHHPHITVDVMQNVETRSISLWLVYRKENQQGIVLWMTVSKHNAIAAFQELVHVLRANPRLLIIQ